MISNLPLCTVHVYVFLHWQFLVHWREKLNYKWLKTHTNNKKRLNDPILGSLPGDFDTTDNPGFNPGGGGSSGLPSDFTDGPLPFDNFPLGPNGGGGGDNIDNNIDTGDETNDVNCDYLGTCYDGMQFIFQ